MDSDASILSLYKMLTAGGNLSKIISMAETLIGNPIAVTNSHLDVLAYSQSHNVNDLIWNHVIAVTDMSYSFYQTLKETDILETAQHQSQHITHIPHSNHRWITGLLQFRGKYLGNILILEYKKPFEEKDSLILKALCDTVSYYISNHEFNGTVRDPLREKLFIDLISGKSINSEVIQNTLDYLPWQKNLIHYVMVLLPDKNMNYDMHPLKDHIEQFDPLFKGIVYENKIIFLLSITSKEIKDERKLQLKDFVEKNHLTAGLSRHFSKIEKMQEYYLQAETSIMLAKRFNQSGNFFRYNHFAIENLIDIASQNCDLTRFYDDALMKLLDLDATYHTNYIRDAYVYIMTGLNISATANILNIHRNTVGYRIGKIEELLNIKFNDPETVFRLNLSFRILRFKKGADFFECYQIPDI